MATWTTPVTHATGDVLAVSDWNGLANDVTFLYQAPYILASSSAGQNVAWDTPTQVQLSSATDAYGMTLSSYNVVVPLTGVYQWSWAIYWDANSTAGAFTNSLLYKNGAQVANGTAQSCYNQGGIITISNGSAITVANAGDQIALYAYAAANSSTTFTIAAGSGLTYLHGFFVGSQ